MTLAELAREISKSQASGNATIPEIKQILGVLARMLVMSEGPEQCLLKHGQRLVNREIKTKGLDADI